MTSLMRILGTLVVIVALAGFVLYKLNEKGFISGNLSSWVTSMTNHVMGIKDDTEEFLHEEGYFLPTATIDPTQPQATAPTY